MGFEFLFLLAEFKFYAYNEDQITFLFELVDVILGRLSMCGICAEIKHKYDKTRTARFHKTLLNNSSSLIAALLIVSFDHNTGRTNGRTDTACSRDAQSHLSSCKKSFSYSAFVVFHSLFAVYTINLICAGCIGLKAHTTVQSGVIKMVTTNQKLGQVRLPLLTPLIWGYF